MAKRTTFKPEYVEQAREFAARGALDKDMAKAFGCALSTFYEWQHRHPEFADALKVSKAIADDAVEAALFRKATGYSFDSEKVFQFEGAPVRVPVVEHVPPSDTAMIFWLKNRRPDQWREKSEIEVKGGLAERLAEAERRLAERERD